MTWLLQVVVSRDKVVVVVLVGTFDLHSLTCGDVLYLRCQSLPPNRRGSRAIYPALCSQLAVSATHTGSLAILLIMECSASSDGNHTDRACGTRSWQRGNCLVLVPKAGSTLPDIDTTCTSLGQDIMCTNFFAYIGQLFTD